MQFAADYYNEVGGEEVKLDLVLHPLPAYATHLEYTKVRGWGRC